MKKGLLIICDTEKMYARKLYEYVYSKYSDLYEVMLFTDTQALAQVLSSRQVEVLLISDDCVISEDMRRRASNTVILTGRAGYDSDGLAVYKYRPAEELLRKIMSVCASTETVEVEEGEKHLKVIGIYTPIKRCFQTTFALTLGQILARNKRTLYLNFEAFSGYEILTDFKGGLDLLDLLYFAECTGGSFSYRINSLVEHIGKLDYIPPVKSFVKYADVSGSQWIKLFDTIAAQTEYEYLILDLSENVNGLLDVLKHCDRVYSITQNDRMAGAKMAHYQMLLKEGAYEEVLNRTENISLPKFRELPQELEMLPYSELADFIRRVIRLDDDEGEQV